MSRDAPLDQLEVGLLGSLGRRSRRRLAERVSIQELRAGDWLFRAGDPGDRLYVVRSGRLDVVAEDEDRVLRRVGRGELVGELALLTGSPRSASVRAHRDCELLSVGREDFEDLLRRDGEFAMGLMRALGGQLQLSAARDDMTRQPDRVIALAGGADRRIVADLVGALREGERVACLDGAGARRDDAAGASDWAALLERTEREHDRVLLIAGEAKDWSAFCLRQADRIVLFGGPEQPIARDAALRGCDLAWVGSAGDGALLAPWDAELRPARRHLLVAGRLDAGIRRLARRLAGRAVGLVLSGGGARALSHIGVLDALDEAGIVVDRIGGCSMGAYVGALYAIGLRPDEVAERCREEPCGTNRSTTTPSHGSHSFAHARRSACSSACSVRGGSKTSSVNTSASVPTSSRRSRSCTAPGRCGRRSGRACPCPGSCHRWWRVSGCWLTAACWTTSPSK